MKGDSPRTKLSGYQERLISTVALVHPRTLRKALAGGQVLPMVRVRIERALREHGLEHLLPPRGSTR